MRTTKAKGWNAANGLFGGRSAKPRGRSKYNIGPKHERTFNGKVYASKVECIRAQELQMLLRAGEIKAVAEQPRFELGIPENVYIADFLVTGKDGRVWVEDVKGRETREFKRNKRLWKKYGTLQLHIIKRKGCSWDRTVIEPGDTKGKA